MAFGFVGVGVLLLLLGSEALLHGGIGLSKQIGLPHLLIGLVVVSAATSAPELAVALEAARAHPEIAVGGVIGGTIANILLVMGLGALIRPLPSPPKVVFRDGAVMLAAALAILGFSAQGALGDKTAVFLLAGFAGYLVLTFATEWRRPAPLAPTEARAHCRDGDRAAGINVLFVVLGIAIVFAGARCLIDGGIKVGEIYRLPQTMVGLTIVALAVALPELVITVTAFARRYHDAVASHVMAANIFNLLVVLGLVALLRPLPIAPPLAETDLLVMAGAALVTMPLMIASWRLSRLNGLFLVLCYGGYLAWLCSKVGWLHLF
ncbi:MAG TPA: calcium/sodium antiporter [Rhizomicrobium sp.]|nr:calcium/sodium antiporter [Rhizomicrobium sp.]